MRIEPYQDNQLSAIVALSLRAWEPVFASIEKTMDADVFQHFHPDWRQSQRKAVETTCIATDTTVWSAREGETIVGFAAVKLHTDNGMGEIYMVAVDPDHQGRGIGTALMQHAMAWMKEQGMVVAMVETGGDPGHGAARRTYEKLGFRLFPTARYFMKL